MYEISPEEFRRGEIVPREISPLGFSAARNLVAKTNSAQSGIESSEEGFSNVYLIGTFPNCSLRRQVAELYVPKQGQNAT